MQVFPNAGAWHSSESEHIKLNNLTNVCLSLFIVQEIFGTFNSTTASAAEKTLSATMQTVWTNFIKNPFTYPAPNWLEFVPGNDTLSLAKLAFNGNVELNNVVQPAPAGLDDGPCDNLWNSLLDF